MGIFSVFTSNSGVIESTILEKDFSNILNDLEEIEVGFKLKHDIFVFTTKRLVVAEKLKDQDSNISYLTIPYSKVSHFSLESKKSFDSHAILKIWLIGQLKPVLEKEFNKSVDVYEVQKILAGHILK